MGFKFICFVNLKWNNYKYSSKRKEKKEKKSGPTISAINSCPKATYYHLRILSTCIACLMYIFKLNTAKERPSHLWHYVIDDQSCKYWIWFSRIGYTNSQTHSMFKSCKSSSWLEREHLQSPWIASLVGSLHCCDGPPNTLKWKRKALSS